MTEFTNTTSPSGNPPPPERAAVIVAVPLALVVGVFGVSFGVLASATPAFGAAAALVMSATSFAGSAQFAALTVMGAGGQALPAIVAAVLLNLRYLPIGVSVAPSLRGSWLVRFLQAQLIVDESWAVSARAGGGFEIRTLVIAGSMLYLAWIVGTAIGVVTGEGLGDPRIIGLDGAFPALFLALAIPQIRTRRAAIAALAGAGVALALVPVAPAGVPIIAAAATASLGLRR